MLISTLVAATAGYVLGTLIGTPIPLRADVLCGRLCSMLAEKISARYQDSPGGRHAAGTAYIWSAALIVFLPTLIILALLYTFIPVLAMIADAFLCWSLADIKGIGRTASAAARAVRNGNLPRASKMAQKLSGENCEGLDADNIVRAAVEGTADRSVDIIGAILYMLILGAPLGLLFKVSGAASAVGSAYGEDFAYPANKLRDVMYYIPGKLAAVIMLVDALFLKFNTRAAERTMQRDAAKCSRHCFGGCRAVIAGIAGISLLPEEIMREQVTRTYTIGEHIKDPDPQDILMASHLLSGTAFIVFCLLFAIKLTLGVWL